ncbi:MAG TPA: hypothetical protein ENI31_01040 [Candidatus Omnitrophica bacterium]|nr:MAG: hypothetical protein DRP69_03475 [Candidatus Omnitrophota bacterium]RKY44776.1 MAG: hypothetical protein DRP80_01015 [Candidatus Omnitrophota bacterium]HEC68861.1 hypothetical protein [Candidatus Omnitrophota bacterium]
MRKVLFLGLLFLGGNLWARPVNENLEYAGYLKTEFWLKNYNDESHLSLSSFKNTFDLEVEYKLSENWAFFFHPRFFYDFAYDLREDFNSNFDRNQFKMGHTQRTEWLRDCYLDFTSDKLDIRIGKQQVVWGQADGLPFLDRVMPFDLSYYWLYDFADIRIPLWMIKVEYSPELNSTLQFLLIPDFEASRSAPAYAPFAFKANNDWYDFKTSYNPLLTIYRPPKQFENSRVGLRWRSILGNDIEYTLNWLYGYSTSAYTYTDSYASLQFSRRHKLMHMIGFSFNKSFVEPGLLEGWTIRGEFAYFHNEPTYYGTDGYRRRTERTDKYTYVLGFDKTFFTNWVFSLQFAQFIHDKKTFGGYQLLNTYTYGLLEKVENYLTLKVSTDFMHERLKPEVLIIYNDDNDGRISFKAKYELRDNFWLTLGYHHFWGPLGGSNGQFRNNDHLVLEAKYTF